MSERVFQDTQSSTHSWLRLRQFLGGGTQRSFPGNGKEDA